MKTLLAGSGRGGRRGRNRLRGNAVVTERGLGEVRLDASRSDVSPDTTITAANLSKLHRLRVSVDGTIDSSPIYVAKGVRGKDAFIFTTTYGKTEAVDASTGHLLWRFTPPVYARLAGSAQVTTSTPALSTDRPPSTRPLPTAVCGSCASATGTSSGETITHDPTHEKITSPLNVSRGLVLATTGGYIGDAPPYQGHVVTMFESTGGSSTSGTRCARTTTPDRPTPCGASDSAIWSRNGAAVDPANGDLVVATGNAPWNGSTNWGDSVLVLSPDAGRLLRHWTPADYDHLNSSDLDLGSTSPSFIGMSGLAVQGGKDGKLPASGPAPPPRRERDHGRRAPDGPAAGQHRRVRAADRLQGTSGSSSRPAAAPPPGVCKAAGCTQRGRTAPPARRR